MFGSASLMSTAKDNSPRAASSRGVAAPIPEAAPITIEILPSIPSLAHQRQALDAGPCSQAPGVALNENLSDCCDGASHRHEPRPINKDHQIFPSSWRPAQMSLACLRCRVMTFSAAPGSARSTASNSSSCSRVKSISGPVSARPRYRRL